VKAPDVLDRAHERLPGVRREPRFRIIELGFRDVQRVERHRIEALRQGV
jgi:hypothetical protein